MLTESIVLKYVVSRRDWVIRDYYQSWPYFYLNKMSKFMASPSDSHSLSYDEKQLCIYNSRRHAIQIIKRYFPRYKIIEI